MKKVLTASIMALSSLTALSACANNSGPVNSNTHPVMQSHHAQYANNGQGHMAMNQGMNTMMAELNLSATQKAQIQALRQSNRGHHMQNREAMMNILTPEQRQKLATMRAQHMKQGGHMMNRGGHMNQNKRMHQNQHMNQNRHMSQ